MEPAAHHLVSLWAGILAGPIAWLLSLQIGFMVVPWACATGKHLAVQIVMLLCLLLVATAGLIAWRNWHGAGAEWPGEADGILPIERFMSIGGVLLSSIFFLLIVAESVSALILGACE
jgi:hypothetical protein